MTSMTNRMSDVAAAKDYLHKSSYSLPYREEYVQLRVYCHDLKGSDSISSAVYVLSVLAL